MNAELTEQETTELHAENIGGIDDVEVTFRPGVTVLEGRNATNRSSLLRALMAACGSDAVYIKGDAATGHVELILNDESYTRHLRDENGTIVAEGSPYLDEPLLADLFAFLLESNEVRQAVERGANLRNILMRPIDTEEIEAEVKQLVEERRVLEAELDEIESLRDELPDLDQERSRLDRQLAEKRAELEETESAIQEVKTDVEKKHEEQPELEAKFDELRDKRSKLDEARYDLETERESLESLRQEMAELREKADQLPGTPMGDIEKIDGEIERLRKRKRSIQQEINDLQSIIRFNEEMLDDADPELLGTLHPDANDEGAGAITDQLSGMNRTTCWTCGQGVETGRIQDTMETLRSLNKTKLDESQSVQNTLDELKEERSALEERRRERVGIERRLDKLDTQIERRKSSIEQLEDRFSELTEEVESTERTVESLQDDSQSELLNLQKEASQLEYELGRLDGEFERVEERISSIEDRLDEREVIEAERESIQEKIRDLRTRIERIAKRAVEEFNEHMDSVLDLLEYGNLERIWLEHVEDETAQGSRTIPRGFLNLHVVRITDGGTSYEDTIDHLSESEREVTGLILALTGYLAYDVHETVPFLLLDSLEAIDAERIGAIINYFAEFTTYLIVALLPEDASAIHADHRLTMDLE